jgi:hypothetical protein
MTTKRLYLDVDGVLNAFPYLSGLDLRQGKFAFGSHWDDDWQRGEANGYIMTWSPSLIDAINEALAHPDGVELYWTTTWVDDAPELIRPLMGIEVDPNREFVVHPRFGQTRSASIVWKMAQIQHRIGQLRDLGAEPGPWVHIDDEMHTVYEDDYYGVFNYQTNAEKSDRGLIIGPDHSVGITPDDWARAVEHWEM